MDKLSQRHMEAIKSGMETLLEDSELADVEILINKKSFPCHRALLANISPYFRAMFTGGMKEANQKQIVIHDLDEAAFEKFRKFVYTGMLDRPEKHIEEILKLATLFQVDCLQDHCEHILMENLCLDNCLGMQRLSLMYSCQKLQQKVWPVLLDNFLYLCKKEEFFELDFDYMVKLVSEDKLVRLDEEQVCEVVLKWVAADETTKRRQYLYPIFRCIRLPHVSTEFLVTRLCMEPLLMDNVDCRTLIQEAQQYHMLPGRRLDWSTRRTRYRSDDEIEEVLLVIAENDAEKNLFCEGDFRLWAFSLQQHRWFTLSPIPYQHSPGPNFAVCTYGYDLYVCGGSKLPKGMLKFETERNEWTVCTGQMKKARCCHCMVTVGNSLFVAGGQHLKQPKLNGILVLGTIEEYYIPAKKWQTVGELSVPVYSATAAASGESVYVFGGTNNIGQNINTIQSFHSRTKATSVISHIEMPGDTLYSTKVDDTMFLTVTLKSRNLMIRLDSYLEVEQITFEIPTNENILAVIHSYGSMLFLIEHEEGQGQLGGIVKVDMRSSSQETIPMAEISCHGRVRACQRTFVNKNFLYHTYFK